MRNLGAVVCCSLLMASGAYAADAAPAGVDLDATGPGARKPTNEKQTKKEVADFFKKGEELEKAGDLDGSVARVDFPVYMATDDMKGVPEGRLWSKDEYTAMMKPMMGHMPKDLKTTHKQNMAVLSDSLVAVTDDWTMTMGKTKQSGKNFTLVVKRDGEWKVKSMVEAGWGGKPAATPAPAPAKK